MAEPQQYANTETVDDSDILLWLMGDERRKTKFIYYPDADTCELWIDHHSDGIYGIDGRDRYTVSQKLVEQFRAKGWLKGQASYYVRMFADHRFVLTSDGCRQSDILRASEGIATLRKKAA